MAYVYKLALCAKCKESDTQSGVEVCVYHSVGESLLVPASCLCEGFLLPVGGSGGGSASQLP